MRAASGAAAATSDQVHQPSQSLQRGRIGVCAEAVGSGAARSGGGRSLGTHHANGASTAAQSVPVLAGPTPPPSSVARPYSRDRGRWVSAECRTAGLPRTPTANLRNRSRGPDPTNRHGSPAHLHSSNRAIASVKESPCRTREHTSAQACGICCVVRSVASSGGVVRDVCASMLACLLACSSCLRRLLVRGGSGMVTHFANRAPRPC